MIIVRDSRWPKRDVMKRQYIIKNELFIVIMRSLVAHGTWRKKYKHYFVRRFSRFGRKCSIAHCRNNCSIRIVGGSTFRFTRMSRYVTKYYASWGYIVGLRRSSF